jgi:hypothetical protein
VRREPADFLCHIRHHRRDSVVVVSLDPHDTRRLGRTKPHGEHRAQHDGHLPEDVARLTLAKDPLDTVYEPRRLDPTLEHSEQRTLSSLVRRVLARHQAHVRRHTRDLLTLVQVESRKQRDATDLLGRHHVWQSRRGKVDSDPVIVRPTPRPLVPHLAPPRERYPCWAGLTAAGRGASVHAHG